MNEMKTDRRDAVAQKVENFPSPLNFPGLFSSEKKHLLYLIKRQNDMKFDFVRFFCICFQRFQFTTKYMCEREWIIKQQNDCAYAFHTNWYRCIGKQLHASLA